MKKLVLVLFWLAGCMSMDGALPPHDVLDSDGNGWNWKPHLRSPSFHTRRVDETALIYMGARYYDPVTGRFLSPDPSRFADSRNLYALTGNDPVNKADPDGRCSKQNMASVFMPQYGVPAQYGSYGTRNWEFDQNSTKKIVHTVGAQVAAMGGGAVGAAVAAPVVTGLGISGGTAAFTVGAVAGASGDALMQGFQIAVGDRQRFSGTEVALSAAAAGVINCAGYALTPKTSPAVVQYQAWPQAPNSPHTDGFLFGARETEMAQPGQVLSRIGSLEGQYVAPQGTSLGARGLPSTYPNTSESLWQVVKPFEMEGGLAAPWLDAPGMGIQYKLPHGINQLQQGGFIRPFTGQ